MNDLTTIMPGRDPSHWLHRLDADEWLRAAANELLRAEEALARKQHRQGVAGARRAAGMAWNAVLVGGEDDVYGRSYMDHLNALSKDPRVPEPVQRGGARAARRAAGDQRHPARPRRHDDGGARARHPRRGAPPRQRFVMRQLL